MRSGVCSNSLPSKVCYTSILPLGARALSAPNVACLLELFKKVCFKFSSLFPHNSPISPPPEIRQVSNPINLYQLQHIKAQALYKATALLSNYVGEICVSKLTNFHLYPIICTRARRTSNFDRRITCVYRSCIYGIFSALFEKFFLTWFVGCSCTQKL